MELQIQDLVDSIKKEGVEAAEKQAAEIIAGAEAKALEIVSKAKADAERVKEENLKEIDIFRENAKKTAEQAKRDAVLAFEKEVQAHFERILNADVKKEMSSKNLSTLITAALSGSDVSEYRVEVASVTDALVAKLASEIKEGLEVQPVKDIDSGFRIAAKDGSGYFDCTADEVTKMLEHFMGNLNI